MLSESKKPLSQARLARNRANARKPEGLRNDFGPAHPELADDFDTVDADLVELYQPVNSQEMFAVWRMTRARRGLFNAAIVAARENEGTDLNRGISSKDVDEALKFLRRYQAHVKRSHRRAIEDLISLRSMRALFGGRSVAEARPVCDVIKP